MSSTDITKNLMFGCIVVFLLVVHKDSRFMNARRVMAVAAANAKQKIAQMPPEIMTEIFASVFLDNLIILVRDAQVFNQACLIMPRQALDVGLSCQMLREHSAGTIRTMVCRHRARASDLPTPYRYLHRIQHIILENGHDRDINSQAFPALRSIVCRAGPRYHIVVECNDARVTEDPSSTTLVRQRGAVHAQLTELLPVWLRNIVTNPRQKIDVELELALSFSKPLTVREHSWDAGSSYPVFDTWTACRFDWRSGKIFDMCSYF